MARKLKTYQTSLGFFDLAIAAPSMKAALEAWGAGSNLFHQGVARETDDPDVVAATMSKPGVILRRPAGSSGRFAEHSDLPTGDEAGGGRENRRPKAKKRPPPEISEKAAGKLHWILSGSRSGTRPSVERSSLPRPRSASGVKGRSLKPRRLSMKLNAIMMRGQPPLRPTARLSKSESRMRRLVGRSRRRSLRLLCAARGANSVISFNL
jgi:hypothetical protein